MSHMLREFRSTIRHMPLLQQACVSKRETWRNIKDPDREFQRLIEPFTGGEYVMISRKDLFGLGSRGPSVGFLYATYIWGYPNGGRGRFASVVANKARILRVLRSVQENVDAMEWSATCNAVKGILGLGVSTFTKLLYFLRVKIAHRPALILDSKVIEVLKRKVFPELASLAEIRYDSAMREYPQYLRTMADEAGKLDVRPDKLEMFLFSFGNSLKS
jgi:hypothetical protein